MKKKDFTEFMGSVITDLRAGGYHGTAHIYKNSLRTLMAFRNEKEVSFKEMTPDLLKAFETYMRQKQCSWNTVSTYLRALRATYNRAVDKHLASYVPRLFKHVYTGTRADKKRALDVENMALLFQSWKEEEASDALLSRAQGLFVLMFLLRGLPFVDLAYMHKKDLHGNTITYHRRKTGRQLTVVIPVEAMLILERYMDTNPNSPYLFPILSSAEGSVEAYQEYQRALRVFNHQLGLLATTFGIHSNLSSYTARHTWATLAYHCEIHPGIISEAMGHSSISVTETYLKPFNMSKINEANLKIISFVNHSV